MLLDEVFLLLGEAGVMEGYSSLEAEGEALALFCWAREGI